MPVLRERMCLLHTSISFYLHNKSLTLLTMQTVYGGDSLFILSLVSSLVHKT